MKQFVSRSMAQLIIYRLKAIQIDEQDGEEFLDEVKSDMLKATPDR